MASGGKVTIRFWCNRGIGKQSKWWVISRWVAKNLEKKVAFLPILSNHHWSIPGKLSIIQMKEARPPLWNWSENERQDRDGWGIGKVADHIPRYSNPSWSSGDFWVREGPQLSSALLTLKNQFVIYSPNLKLLILVFVRGKNERIVP